MIRVITLFILVSGFHVLNAQKSNPLQWLEGTWRLNTGQGFVVEQWKVVNDSTLSGKSFFIKQTTDTIPQESIELTLRKGQWIYSPTVHGQNNNSPVHFVVIFLRGTEFICENQAHDFPQRIAYRRMRNQLLASIEGRRNGRYTKQNFDFSNE